MFIVEQQLKALEEEAEKTQSNAYAKGTKDNLQIQWALYFNFCSYFNFSVLSAQKKVLVLYIQFLTTKLTALASIKNYVAGVCTLHELLELDMSAFNDIKVKLMWMGLDRTWTRKVCRAAPMTPEILRDIHEHLDLSLDTHLVFWSACLVGFFILACKSNLVPVGAFEPGKQLSSKHVKFDQDKVEVELHWTKTRRPGQEPIVYPLHKIPNSRVCPYSALKSMFDMISRGPDEPCFVLKNGKPLMYSHFQKLLKNTLEKAGYAKDEFSSHSFRSGGATFASRSGVLYEVIKMLGDWHSSAYERYLESPIETREAAGLLMRQTIMQLGL